MRITLKSAKWIFFSFLQKLIFFKTQFLSQAAIGSIPLDTARRYNLEGEVEETYGIQIVTIAVLVILITAPIGAIGMSLTGPRWLQKNEDEEMQQNIVSSQ